ncbi:MULTISPECIES: chromate efflux transporter [unclassified Undibacterium]|uniref:chromate efflux transporter n=1 Tax=unclassified Undibacterium TaxID=2630295 RepID=UPI002AC8CF12|nr:MULTISPECIES: chromate efflux transporter [unclassified Undibacterium]MEB0138712.1 chromate efflux transporter [Undibacterium sp. CCC2.1]MEB0171513.1 chromate efflux transporter [Undibacterium sp. CCC1.1]MEB0175416.1 chromate efflux transporter [Undibacterium sp. CCC3.4]MEB0214713.1 chromate efflux transporter [Undibacterium sp. 5I2]WPX43328.1 chromate efflux transporter [Undibacterium sp. CCC3.4]
MLPAPLPSDTVSLRSALAYWLKLGCLSFGGPAGQIAMMHAELVEKRRWISEARFLHALNYCMLLPGPEATQLAIYIGWLMHKTRGGILAGILFILPSLGLLIALSYLYLQFGQHHLINGVLAGIRPAVAAIVCAAAWRIGRRSLTNVYLRAIAILSFIAITVLSLPFPLILLVAAVLGTAFAASIAPPDATAKSASAATALIDDNSPTPAHARFQLGGLLRIISLGVALGVLAWAALEYCFGPNNPLSEMTWFFTKTALLCFGGAYAVLPYVFQNAVEHFHWLSASQMMDGLALGESTPGPLIIVVAFIGYLGAAQLHSNPLLGALVAAAFTFLPSFLFILAGGPLVEASRTQWRLNAPLKAIAAAVVGVIASLALFFVSHISQNAAGALDYRAIALMAVAGVALFRFQVGSISLLSAFAVFGALAAYCQWPL